MYIYIYTKYILFTYIYIYMHLGYPNWTTWWFHMKNAGPFWMTFTKTRHIGRLLRELMSAMWAPRMRRRQPSVRRGWIPYIHPWKLTWNPKMEVWKMISLVKQVIFRFHVNFPGCTSGQIITSLRSPKKKMEMFLSSKVNTHLEVVGFPLPC